MMNVLKKSKTFYNSCGKRGCEITKIILPYCKITKNNLKSIHTYIDKKIK